MLDGISTAVFVTLRSPPAEKPHRQWRLGGASVHRITLRSKTTIEVLQRVEADGAADAQRASRREQLTTARAAISAKSVRKSTVWSSKLPGREEMRKMVLYIDNHLRPYTGKHTIRKGWRMQDKQVRPGVTDIYVHDEDGRPVYRLDVPSNEGLTTWMTPVMQILRAALGEGQRILVAFDRGGAFPEQLAELRDEGFEFVTYERRPYQNLSASLFSEEVTVDGERIGVHESRLKNLGHGRGRVRRIALRMPEGQHRLCQRGERVGHGAGTSSASTD